MVVDSFGLTPLLSAACIGNSRIVDFLISRSEVGIRERIDGLEILGATFVDKKRDITGAVRVWRQAVILRMEYVRTAYAEHEATNLSKAKRPKNDSTTDFQSEIKMETAPCGDNSNQSTGAMEWESSDDPAPKTSTEPPTDKALAPRPKTTIPVVAYRNQAEFTDEVELDQIRGDPDLLRMQALLIRERILGPAHPDTSYYIRYRGAVYADLGEFNRCFELWCYALAMQQRILEPLCALTQSSFVSFAELFFFMLNDNPSNSIAAQAAARQKASYTDIAPVLCAALYELRRGLAAIAQLQQIHLELQQQQPCTSSTVLAPAPPVGLTMFAMSSLSATSMNSNTMFNLRASQPRTPAMDQLLSPSSAAPSSPIRQQVVSQQMLPVPILSQAAMACQSLGCPHAGGDTIDQQKSASLGRMCSITLHLVCLATMMESRMSPEEGVALRRLLYELIAMDPRPVTYAEGTLLHLACSPETSNIGRHPVCRFPALNVVSSMLEAGAPVNATDATGNTPLHTILTASTIARPSIVQTLLEAGAHIDARNLAGMRVLDLLKPGMFGASSHTRVKQRGAGGDSVNVPNNNNNNVANNLANNRGPQDGGARGNRGHMEAEAGGGGDQGAQLVMVAGDNPNNDGAIVGVPAVHRNTNKYNNVCPLQFLTLKCLAAQTVTDEGIAFRGTIPKALERFLENH